MSDMKDKDMDIFDALRNSKDISEFDADTLALAQKLSEGFKLNAELETNPSLANKVMRQIEASQQEKITFFEKLFSWTPQLVGVAASLLLFSLNPVSTTLENNEDYLGMDSKDSVFFDSTTPSYSALLDIKIDEEQ